MEASTRPGCGTSVRTVSTPPEISTLAELRASGHHMRTLREEIRENLLAALAAGVDPWPGLHGFGTTVFFNQEKTFCLQVRQKTTFSFLIRERYFVTSYGLLTCYLTNACHSFKI